MDEVCEKLYPSVFGNAEFFTRPGSVSTVDAPKQKKLASHSMKTWSLASAVRNSFAIFFAVPKSFPFLMINDFC